MRILVATPFMASHFDAGFFWIRALVNMMHSVYPWDYRLQTEMPKVDADFSLVFKGESIDPNILPRPRVNVFPDWFGFFPPSVEQRIKQYDLVFHLVLENVKKTGGIWLPGAYDELIHRDLNLRRHIDTMYIGTANSDYKVNMIRSIAPQVIAGNNWGTYRINARPAHYLYDFVTLANQAKTLICAHRAPEDGITRKVFELVSCGFTIVDHVPGIEEIFPGIWDKFTFRTPEEAKELIQYYLSHEAERNELWQKQKKAIEPYSYENCCLKMLECLKSVA